MMQICQREKNVREEVLCGLGVLADMLIFRPALPTIIPRFIIIAS